jgi:hypothetical protein
MPITHSFVSGKSDGGDATLVRPSDWNASHAGVFAGQPVAIGLQFPGGLPTTGTNNLADLAWAIPIIVPGTMLVRGLSIDITTSAAGSLQWGLFDYSASITAATKLAGGSAAPGGTGWRSIAAASAPVTVQAGAYMLVLKQPTSTVPTIRCITAAGAIAVPWNQVWTTYTWDDTPDFSSASWVANATIPVLYLEGDLDGSGTRWT